MADPGLSIAYRKRPRPAARPFVISGGSVEISFDERTYTGGNGSYKNERRKIVSVEIIDHNTQQTQTVQIPANGKCTVRIETK